MKKERAHYFVNATKLPIRISRNKTATVTKLLGEKYFAQRKEASVSMKEQDWLYEKKNPSVVS